MKIKVLTGYDGVCSYRDIVLGNFREYCDRWGYELVAKFDGWGDPEILCTSPDVLEQALNSPETPTDMKRWLEKQRVKGSGGIFDLFWRKHQLILEELHDCDWLLWLDADCLIMNMTIPLTEFIEESCDLILTGPYHDDLCGAPLYSIGVMLLRCCPWSKRLVSNWLESRNQSWRKGPMAQCWYLADANWLCCNFLRDAENLTHFKALPPEEAGHYAVNSPEQFVAHLYGCDDKGRAFFLTKMLESVQR